MGEQFAGANEHEHGEVKLETDASKEAFRSSVALLTTGGKNSSERSDCRTRSFAISRRKDVELLSAVSVGAQNERSADKGPQTVARVTFGERLDVRHDRRESYHLRDTGEMEIFVDVVDPIERLRQRTLFDTAKRIGDKQAMQKFLGAIDDELARIERAHQAARRRGEAKVSEAKLKEVNAVLDAIIHRKIFGREG